MCHPKYVVPKAGIARNGKTLKFKKKATKNKEKKQTTFLCHVS